MKIPFHTALIFLASAWLGASAPAAEPFVSQQEKDYAKENLAVGKLDAGKVISVARELNARGGLPHFFTKARAGQPVTVVYFGGSITAHEGWRPQSFAGLQRMFPQGKMTMVNSCVGGSGSLVGVFRADRDLVAKKPDLVFIEFAVNDGSDAVKRTQDVVRALEGIIRKVRIASPEADICMVYTMQTANVETIRKGNAQPAVLVHEQVAGHYNLPSIYVGPAVVKAIDAGEAVFFGKVVDKATGRDADGKLVISEDNTHPVLPTGHAFYAKVVLRALGDLAGLKREASRALPKPIGGASWEQAHTIPAEGNAAFKGDWEKLTAANGPDCMRFGKRFYEWFPHLYRTTSPGSSVTVRFKGTLIGLKGIDGPDSGMVTVKIDDRPATTDNHFTVYNTRSFYVGNPLPELADGEHTVTWTLSDQKPDKAKILSGKPANAKDLADNPAKYSGTMFSVGEITLIGEVLPPPAP
jgi:hypothetical protein